MDGCQVLGQRPEVGIVTGIPNRLRPPRDGLRTGAIVALQRELVEKLAYRVAKVLAGANSLRNSGKGLG